MKIAISSIGTTKNSLVDQHFGRCKYFSIYDIESKTYSALANDAGSYSEGAGIQAAQHLADSGVSIVLTRNIGPNAHTALQAAGITVITGVSGTVVEALEMLSKGDYWPTDQPTVQAYFGVGS